MVVTLTPLRSVFHALHNVPGSSVFSAPRATATLPQHAPHNSHSNRPINVANGHRDDPLVTLGYSPSNRYQPYPQPQVLAPGQHLVFSQRKGSTRRGSRSRLVDPRTGGVAGQPLAPTHTPYPQHTVDVIMSDDFLPTVNGRGVEIGGATGVSRVNIADVEMEDDFPPPIPAIIVTPPDE